MTLLEFIRQDVPSVIQAVEYRGGIEVIHGEIGAPYSLEIWVGDEYPDAEVTQIGDTFAGCTRWVVEPSPSSERRDDT